MSGMATVKLSTWQPQLIPVSEDERLEIIRIVNEAVWSVWKLEHRPTNLKEIYDFYKAKVNALRRQGKWMYVFRGKRTVDRRVNECASSEYHATIVAVTSGIYQPNPELIELFEAERKKVEGEKE
jgi:hypothetical protein